MAQFSKTRRSFCAFVFFPGIIKLNVLPYKVRDAPPGVPGTSYHRRYLVEWSNLFDEPISTDLIWAVKIRGLFRFESKLAF
jgi:hypothetical protein